MVQIHCTRLNTQQMYYHAMVSNGKEEPRPSSLRSHCNPIMIHRGVTDTVTQTKTRKLFFSESSDSVSEGKGTNQTVPLYSYHINASRQMFTAGGIHHSPALLVQSKHAKGEWSQSIVINFLTMGTVRMVGLGFLESKLRSFLGPELLFVFMGTTQGWFWNL